MGKTPDLMAQVMAEPGGEQLHTCLSCGTCTAVCPIQWWNPAYNPRRLLRLAVMGQSKALLTSPTIWFCSACDQCYHRCPRGVRLSDIMAAIRAVALRLGIEPDRDSALVNERICAGCGQCAELCPYQAIALQVRRVLGKQKKVATVSAVRCLQCGICAAACRSNAITVPSFADGELLRQVRACEVGRLEPVEARL